MKKPWRPDQGFTGLSRRPSRRNHYIPNGAGLLLSRLDGVRQTGDSKWLARCPSHEDRSPSLSISETNDGTILIHCFAGCGGADVVGAVGLEWSALFPDRPTDHRRKPIRPHVDYRAVLRCVAVEARIIEICAGDLANGVPLGMVDRDLVQRAYANIERIASRWA